MIKINKSKLFFLFCLSFLYLQFRIKLTAIFVSKYWVFLLGQWFFVCTVLYRSNELLHILLGKFPGVHHNKFHSCREIGNYLRQFLLLINLKIFKKFFVAFPINEAIVKFLLFEQLSHFFKFVIFFSCVNMIFAAIVDCKQTYIRAITNRSTKFEILVVFNSY